MNTPENKNPHHTKVLIYSVFKEHWTREMIKLYEGEELRKNKMLSTKSSSNSGGMHSTLEDYVEESKSKRSILFLDGEVTNITRNQIKEKTLILPTSKTSEGVLSSLTFIGTENYFTKISFNPRIAEINLEPVVINLKYHHTKYSREYLLDYIESLDNMIMDGLKTAEREHSKVSIGIIYNPNIGEYEVGYMRIEEKVPSLSEYIIRKYIFETGITGNKKNFTGRKSSPKKRRTTSKSYKKIKKEEERKLF